MENYINAKKVYGDPYIVAGIRPCKFCGETPEIRNVSMDLKYIIISCPNCKDNIVKRFYTAEDLSETYKEVLVEWDNNNK